MKDNNNKIGNKKMKDNKNTTSLVETLKSRGYDNKNTKLIMELVELGSGFYDGFKRGLIGGNLKDITPTQNNLPNVLLWVNVCIEVWKECSENGVELKMGEFDKVGDFLTETLIIKMMDSELVVWGFENRIRKTNNN